MGISWATFARPGSICTALLALACTHFAHGSERNDDVASVWSFVFENDMFIFDDGGYTNGMGYNWSYGPFESFEDRTPGWMEWLTDDLYIATMPDKHRRISYAIVQEIYTPEEIVIKELQPLDRPYAGLLTWQADWFAYDEHLSDRVGLELGLVGSAALGEQTQKVVHQITGANEPEGWDEQLENEPIFRVTAARNWRLLESLSDDKEYDIIGHLYGGLGTRRSDLGSGVTFRYGKELRRSFANASLNPARGVNLNAAHPHAWYVFLGLGADYVFNDITLDGNTFENSHSVDLEHWQASATIGGTINFGRWGLLFSIRGITDEFDTQEKDSLYGALSISYDFDGE